MTTQYDLLPQTNEQRRTAMLYVKESGAATNTDWVGK